MLEKGCQAEIMFTANKRKAKRNWKQVVLKDSGPELDLVGADKVEKDGTKKTMKKRRYGCFRRPG